MRFQVNAIDAKQEIVVLNLHAVNEAAATAATHKLGLTVLSIRPQMLDFRFALGRPPAFPVLLFSVELMALLDAGLNLVEALQTLGEKDNHSERQNVLSGILWGISRGESFSQAVGRFPGHFSPLYVATLKASEQTGDLHQALSRYIAYEEEFDRLRKQIVSAMIYPAILIVVGGLVLAFLMFYVVPRFARVYEGVSGDLPFSTALLLAVGRGIQQYGWWIGLLGACGVALGVFVALRASSRAWLNARLWRIPALGDRMKTFQLARLYRTIGMLLRAGIPALQALDMVRDLLASHLRPHLARARKLVAEGRSMSDALGATGLTTPVGARMMVVGERSGKMGEMMGRIARFHDEEMSRFTDRFTRAFEPLLMAALGIAVGGVVVLMYMPIFELAGSIQ